MRAGQYFAITLIAVGTHLGALAVTSIAMSSGASELNPLFVILGPVGFQVLDFALINMCALLVWFLPIPSRAKTFDICFLALCTSADFVRDLLVYYIR